MRIKFNSLPVYRGVVNKYPISVETAPFEIAITKNGYPQQINRKNINEIVDYSNSNYNFLTTPPGKSNWGNKRAEAQIEYVLGEIQNVKGKRVLDIGGGTTYIVEKLVNDHRAKSGIIIDPTLKEDSNNTKIDVVQDYFSVSHINDYKADIILCFACFEHLPNPVSFLNDIKLLCGKNNASVILSFPDTERQFSQGDLNTFLHEHISYFNAKSAENLFLDQNFIIKSIVSQNDSLFCHIKNNIYDDQNHSVDQIKKIISLDKFEKSISYMKKELHNLLTIKKESVVFHGATNGLNNTLFLAGFSKHPKIFVYDIDEYKVGCFLPTCVNPIRHASDETYKDFDNVFISAMSFYNECHSFLKNKHRINNIKPILPL